MQEKYVLENLLTLTKSISMLYINGVIESSNKDVRKIMLEGLDYSLESQWEIYETLVNLGYYKPEDAKKSEIEKLANKINQDC